jgi:hypothetical protein
MKAKGNWEDRDVDERIIFTFISNKCAGMTWIIFM